MLVGSSLRTDCVGPRRAGSERVVSAVQLVVQYARIHRGLGFAQLVAAPGGQRDLMPLAERHDPREVVLVHVVSKPVEDHGLDQRIAFQDGELSLGVELDDRRPVGRRLVGVKPVAEKVTVEPVDDHGHVPEDLVDGAVVGDHAWVLLALLVLRVLQWMQLSGVKHVHLGERLH